MSDKPRYPYVEALAVAESLKAALAPFCSRIEICGSLRRKRPTVGDVEILYISKPGRRQVDLLATEEYGEAEKHLDWLLYKSILGKRANKNGVCSWGAKNKLAFEVASGIPVDFFATTEACWWNSLVVRTGGKQSNLEITTAAQRQGYSFEAYGSGFRALHPEEGGNVRDHYETKSEADVFEFVGLPYLRPEDRQ